MKRHDSLAPLSREHHHALILAQLLKKAAPVYKDLPVDNSGKVVYAQNMYNNSLKEHFRKEEQVIGKVQHCHAEIERIGKEIILEHELLTKSFLDLGNSVNLEADLDQLGIALDLHIRKEERILFPLIQQHCGEAILNEIDFD